MLVSHIALLSLAASTAAPVFAAPINLLKVRSEYAGASLSARDPRGDCAEGTSNYAPGAIARNVPGDVIPEFLAARVTTKDSVDSMLKGRGLAPGNDIQARGLFSLFDIGLSILGQLLKRDVTPENLLARDGVEGLVNSISSRDSSPGEQMQARDTDGLATLMDALIADQNDATSNTLGARGEFEDFLKALNTRRNTADDIDMSRHSAREPSPQQETQARSDDSTSALIKAILGSRDEQEMQSRSDDSTSALIKAILGSRDDQEMQSRSDDSTSALVKAILGPRDEQEMQSRSDDSTSALIKAILGSRDEQEMQSRSDDSTSALVKAILGSRDDQEMQSRSDDSTSSLIKAFLNSRDLSRRLTNDEVLKLLASRPMDDLD